MADRVEEPVFHLALREEWEVARRSGVYDRSTIGRSLAEEGFIHCSFAEQVPGVAARFYAGRTDLVLLTIDPGRCHSVWRVESPAPGVSERFPHLYGPLPVDAVVCRRRVPVDADGVHDLSWLARRTGTPAATGLAEPPRPWYAVGAGARMAAVLGTVVGAGVALGAIRRRARR